MPNFSKIEELILTQENSNTGIIEGWQVIFDHFEVSNKPVQCDLEPQIDRINSEVEVFIYFQKNNSYRRFVLSDLMFYKGLYKVKVITQSEGYWIVEALEDFEDTVDGEKAKVKVGERRIIAPSELHSKKTLPPTIPEHLYERRLEQKVKQIVEDYEKKNNT